MTILYIAALAASWFIILAILKLEFENLIKRNEN